jgi:hypothetical protein
MREKFLVMTELIKLSNKPEFPRHRVKLNLWFDASTTAARPMTEERECFWTEVTPHVSRYSFFSE